MCFMYDFFANKIIHRKKSHMLNKKSIKSILNVKHTCIDSVKFCADTIYIRVHATKGQQCRCGICGRKSPVYDQPYKSDITWRACDWAGHKGF